MPWRKNYLQEKKLKGKREGKATLTESSGLHLLSPCKGDTNPQGKPQRFHNNQAASFLLMQRVQPVAPGNSAGEETTPAQAPAHWDPEPFKAGPCRGRSGRHDWPSRWEGTCSSSTDPEAVGWSRGAWAGTPTYH